MVTSRLLISASAYLLVFILLIIASILPWSFQLTVVSDYKESDESVVTGLSLSSLFSLELPNAASEVIDRQAFPADGSNARYIDENMIWYGFQENNEPDIIQSMVLSFFKAILAAPTPDWRAHKLSLRGLVTGYCLSSGSSALTGACSEGNVYDWRDRECAANDLDCAQLSALFASIATMLVVSIAAVVGLFLLSVARLIPHSSWLGRKPPPPALAPPAARGQQLACALAFLAVTLLLGATVLAAVALPSAHASAHSASLISPCSHRGPCHRVWGSASLLRQRVPVHPTYAHFSRQWGAPALVVAVTALLLLLVPAALLLIDILAPPRAPTPAFLDAELTMARDAMGLVPSLSLVDPPHALTALLARPALPCTKTMSQRMFVQGVLAHVLQQIPQPRTRSRARQRSSPAVATPAPASYASFRDEDSGPGPAAADAGAGADAAGINVHARPDTPAPGQSDSSSLAPVPAAPTSVLIGSVLLLLPADTLEVARHLTERSPPLLLRVAAADIRWAICATARALPVPALPDAADAVLIALLPPVDVAIDATIPEEALPRPHWRALLEQHRDNAPDAPASPGTIAALLAGTVTRAQSQREITLSRSASPRAHTREVAGALTTEDNSSRD